MVNGDFFDEMKLKQLEEDNEWYAKNYGPRITKRGFGNFKNLFRRPNILEWTILAMLIMGLFMGWAYQRDIAICREYINNQQNFFEDFNPTITSHRFNISNVSIVTSYANPVYIDTEPFNATKANLILQEENIKKSGG